MEAFIEIFQSIVMPGVTLIVGYFGWKANAEKNKLKAEVEGMKATNVAKEIENQNSWIDLYKKLHDDLALRLTDAEKEISELKKTIYIHEVAFQKANACPYGNNCPIIHELSKSKNINKRKKRADDTDNRQREPP
ncbi:hypothetical protein [Dysgonomonas sp. Marseille-P4361]|uniref:hypothetical protein n=1 Tax=Dysgonomonas sp. Marseille-P4361 TaxID=2161820 RepID=UPI000D551BD4|nr:hypothetical protein [Dysgonomonas sp. Marseille-P4361]